MRFLARLGAIIIILFIIPSTACAFWVFNLNRVALNQSTYATMSQTPRLSSELLAAFLEGFTDEGAPRDAHVILLSLPPDVWSKLAENILPTEKAKTLLDKVLNTFFGWLDGKNDRLDLMFDMSEIKSRLSAEQLADKLPASALRTMPPCTPEMNQQLAKFTDTSSFKDFPVCQPNDATLLETERTGLITALSLIAKQLPDTWSFADEMSEIADTPPQPPAAGDFTHRINRLETENFRAFIRLESRLLMLLFLIPIALLCVLIMVHIRSLKAFFRWIGWALVISGIISLLPVFSLPGFNSGLSEARVSIALRIGTGGGQALSLFSVQAIQSIVNELTLSVLFQVAGLIVIGLILVFISVVLPHRHDELSDEEMAMLLSPAPEISRAG